MRAPALGSLDRLRRAAVQLVASLPDNVMRVAGSGAVLEVTEDGRRATVATCAHVWDELEAEVVEGGRPLALFLGDQSLERGEVAVGVKLAAVEGHVAHPAWRARRSPGADVALLEVRGDDLPRESLPLGLVPPRVGTEVALVGFPGRAGLRVTLGWWQGPGPDGVPRCLLGSEPGESGGPVVSLETGELVGLLVGGEGVPAHPYVNVAASWLAPASALRTVVGRAPVHSEP